VNADYCVKNLIPKLVENATALMTNGLSFNRMALKLQNWLHANSSDFTARDEWPLNSPNLDNHVWCVMLEAYTTSWSSKPSTTDELLQTRLEMMWNDLLQKPWQGLSRTFISDYKRQLL